MSDLTLLFAMFAGSATGIICGYLIDSKMESVRHKKRMKFLSELGGINLGRGLPPISRGYGENINDNFGE